MKQATATAALPAATTLLGAFAGDAAAAGSPALPDYAPVSPTSVGPALNSDGYFVGRIRGDLYWITDSYYQAMFLTTRKGVVLVYAPPTIGRNLLRAIAEVTQSNGRPAKVTHLITPTPTPITPAPLASSAGRSCASATERPGSCCSGTAIPTARRPP
ncbi:hypothetical protein [Streptomyces zhihengii]|uniref:hypothetical protein n=1 Tax=Streptomyces zhihengii TaxID=1818004 RepID=UPI0033B36376